MVHTGCVLCNSLVVIVIITATRVQKTHTLCVLQHWALSVKYLLHCRCQQHTAVTRIAGAFIVTQSQHCGRHNNTPINQWPCAYVHLGPATQRGHTSMSKETGVALNLRWTNSQPSHSWHLSAKGKRYKHLSRIFCSGGHQTGNILWYRLTLIDVTDCINLLCILRIG